MSTADDVKRQQRDIAATQREAREALEKAIAETARAVEGMTRALEAPPSFGEVLDDATERP